MTDRNGGWIQTYTGLQFWPLDARPSEIQIEDIAHALATTTRYGGHTLGYYSVAQHSVLVSQACKPEHALWGLLHDAAEAYLGDVVRPVKHGPGMEPFRQFEDALMTMICTRFGLSYWEPDSVKWADAALLATEKRDLLRKMQEPMGEVEWLHGAPSSQALSTTIVPWEWREAEQEFLARFEELWRARIGLFRVDI